MTKRILYFQSRDTEKMTAFSEACLAITPKIFLYRNQELFLDIAPTLKYFGGEIPILLTIEEWIESFEWRGLRVLSDRFEWARALASAGEVFIKSGDSQNKIYALPIDRISLCGDPWSMDQENDCREEIVAFMKRVGIHTIGDFAQLPSPLVSRRFGSQGKKLQEWARGEREVNPPVFTPEASLIESLDAEEVTSLEALLFLLRQLLVRLEARLRGRALLAKELKLIFHLEGAKPLKKIFGLSDPLQESKSILRLLKEYLSHLQWSAPLSRLEVEVSDAIPFEPGQLSLWDTRENQYADLAQYVTRLRLRYGEESVGIPKLEPSYIPEKSWRNSWPQERNIGSSHQISYATPKRPLFIFSPPRPCQPDSRWKIKNSENLMTEWWQTGGSRRYFIAYPPTGEKLWIYWDGQKDSWYLQGTFD